MYLQELTERHIKPISSDTPAMSQKIVTFAKTFCQPWLSQTDNGKMIVYRGMNKEHEPAFVKKTRRDRRPLSSVDFWHNAYQAILQTMNSPATRTNSLFCTGKLSDTTLYGKSYVVIPIGHFNYSWSPVWSDWTMRVEVSQLKKMLKQPIADNLSSPRGHINPGIEGACANPSNYIPEEVAKYVTVDEGLQDAINSGNEIMIKCSAGLYIVPELFKELDFS